MAVMNQWGRNGGGGYTRNFVRQAWVVGLIPVMVKLICRVSKHGYFINLYKKKGNWLLVIRVERAQLSRQRYMRQHTGI